LFEPKKSTGFSNKLAIRSYQIAIIKNLEHLRGNGREAQSIYLTELRDHWAEAEGLCLEVR
jgi:hypothetical protein